MNHEDRVFTLLIESNPIPSVDDLDVDVTFGARYLETLEQRSSEVIQVDERRDEAKTGKRKQWVAIAAVVLAVIAIGAMLLITNEPEPVAPDPESVINQFVTAKDFETLAATLSDDQLLKYRDRSELAGADSVDEELIRNEFEALGILGVEYGVESCAEVVPGNYRCELTYHDHVKRAFGEPPVETTWTFYVEDGLITTGAGEFAFGYGGDSLGSFFAQFANTTSIREAFVEACPGVLDLVPSCAIFIMDSLDDWVAWRNAG